MADKTSIEWTRGADGSPGATWNPITGCTVVSPGCTNCYAMRLAGTRMRNHPSRVGLTKDSKAGPVWTGEVRLNEEWLDQPLRWKRPRMIFVCAHSDLFHETVPDELIDRLFAVMALASWHTFQVLTKRAERMRRYLSDAAAHNRIADATADLATRFGKQPPERFAWPLPNVWPGVSAEDQQRADERIPHLLATPAAVRWVSAEPLLGPIDLSRIDVDGHGEVLPLTGWQPEPGALDSEGRPTNGHPRIDWIVAGGESGPGARPMHPDWARGLRDQCAAAGVAFHFKQWGEFAPAKISHKEWCSPRPLHQGEQALAPNGEFTHRPATDPLFVMRRVGKARAGRLLDSAEHNGMPATHQGDRP